MNKIEIENNYYNYKFDIYKVEVGVLWTKDEEHEDYDCYNSVYDKQYGYYDENVAFKLDYNKALEYARNYVENETNEENHGNKMTLQDLEEIADDIINNEYFGEILTDIIRTTTTNFLGE